MPASKVMGQSRHVKKLRRPIGRLWGLGRMSTIHHAQALQNSMAAGHASLCNGTEHAGLDQERRVLVARTLDLSWEGPQAHQLVLALSLPAGSYASSVLTEILCTAEPDRHRKRVRGSQMMAISSRNQVNLP